MALVFAVMHLYNIFKFFIAICFLKSGIDKLTELSMIPVCPSLMCFFNRGNTEETNSSKKLWLTFVYVLLYVNLCQDWFCGFGGICGLMTCVQSK